MANKVKRSRYSQSEQSVLSSIPHDGRTFTLLKKFARNYGRKYSAVRNYWNKMRKAGKLNPNAPIPVFTDAVPKGQYSKRTSTLLNAITGSSNAATHAGLATVTGIVVSGKTLPIYKRKGDGLEMVGILLEP